LRTSAAKAARSPSRQRSTSDSSSASLITNTRLRGKGWKSFSGGLDLEDPVEARILEDVADMAADAREPELAVGGEEALLGLEQHPQAGARNVLEPGAIEGHGPLDLVEEGLGRGR